MLMVTQAKKLIKTKSDHIILHNHNETVTKHMVFPFYRNSWQTLC